MQGEAICIYWNTTLASGVSYPGEEGFFSSSYLPLFHIDDKSKRHVTYSSAWPMWGATPLVS